MELTGKQKRDLRSLGQHLDPVCTVGKAGVTDAIVAKLASLLDHHDLIKVRIATEGEDRNDVAQFLADATHSALVGVLGRTFLLYRPNPHAEHQPD